MEKKKSKMQTSRSERRKKFHKWISTDMLRSVGALPYFVPNPNNEVRIANIMSNLDRKRLGLPLDEKLEMLNCDFCNTETLLHLYFDKTSLYLCENCLNEYKSKRKQNTEES